MSYSFGKGIVTDGLVFYVDAANGNSYPGSGNTWIDMVGNNNLTLTNGPTFDSANGGSFLFDGTDDTAPGSVNLTPANLTLSFWIKRTHPSSGEWGSWGNYNLGNNGYNKGVILYGDVGKMKATIGQWNSNVISFDCPQNTVVNVTFTYDGTTQKLYKDGVLEDSSTSSAIDYTGGVDTYWGLNESNQYLYQGYFYNQCLYNRALTSTEITQNYNALKSRFGL